MDGVSGRVGEVDVLAHYRWSPRRGRSYIAPFEMSRGICGRRAGKKWSDGEEQRDRSLLTEDGYRMGEASRGRGAAVVGLGKAGLQL